MTTNECVLSSAVKVVAQISGGRTLEEETRAQTFTTIPAARAVRVYKGDVFYAWAGGIALDAIPTIFVILLSLGRPREEEEKDEEARLAALPNAVPVPQGAPRAPTVARPGAWPGRASRGEVSHKFLTGEVAELGRLPWIIGTVDPPDDDARLDAAMFSPYEWPSHWLVCWLPRS